MDQSSNNKRIAKNTAFLYVRMFLMLIVTFYTTRVLLEKLGIEDFGLYNVVAGFVSMLGFLNTSMSNAIQRFLNFELGKNNIESAIEYFRSSLVVQGLISLCIIIVFESLGLWFLNNKMNIASDAILKANYVFQFSLVLLVVHVMRSPFNAVVIAKERMDFYAILSIFEVLAQLFIAYIISVVDVNRVVIYSFLLLLLGVILLIITVFYSKRIISILSIKPLFDKNKLKELFSFSGWNLFGSISGIVKSQGINVLINVFFGVTVNAARGVAYQVLSGVQKLTSNFQLAMNPQIIQSYSSNHKSRYLKLTYTSAKVSLYLMWLIILPLLFTIEYILTLWLGDNVPEYTSSFILIVLFTGLIDSLGSSISTSFYATGKIKTYQIVVSLITIMVLPISYVLYRFGMPPEASMFVSLGLSIIAQLVRVHLWANLVSESVFEYYKEILLPGVIVLFISSLLVYSLTILTKELNDIYSFLLIVSFSILVNIVAIYMIGLNKQEKHQIRTIIKQLKSWKKK